MSVCDGGCSCVCLFVCMTADGPTKRAHTTFTRWGECVTQLNFDWIDRDGDSSKKKKKEEWRTFAARAITRWKQNVNHQFDRIYSQHNSTHIHSTHACTRALSHKRDTFELILQLRQKGIRGNHSNPRCLRNNNKLKRHRQRTWIRIGIHGSPLHWQVTRTHMRTHTRSRTAHTLELHNE